MGVVEMRSTPIADFDPERVAELARRAQVDPETLKDKHVLFFADYPFGNPTSTAVAVSTVIIVDSPVSLAVQGIGTAVKSREDEFDLERGLNIALARAIDATNPNLA